MEPLFTTVNTSNFVHVSLGWVSFLLLALMLVRKKGDALHRRIGAFTIGLLFAMATLASAFVIYRLFGGKLGPAGFSILGVNKLALPLYFFITAYLFAKRERDDAWKNSAKDGARMALLVAVTAGTAAAIIAKERPYLTGNWLYTFEINGTDLFVTAVLPVMAFIWDKKWIFSNFTRKEQLDQHVLRTIAGTIFIIYASAPWNHLTNAIYSFFLGPPHLGHILLYSGSPFIALYVSSKFVPAIPRAMRRLILSRQFS